MYKSHIDQITRLPHKEKAPQKAAPPQEAAASPAPPPPPAEEPPVKKAPPAPPRKAKRPEPEPELEDEEEDEIPQPPVKKASSKRLPLRLELEEEEDEEDEELEEDDAILSRFSSRFGRRPVRTWWMTTLRTMKTMRRSLPLPEPYSVPNSEKCALEKALTLQTDGSGKKVPQAVPSAGKRPQSSIK